MAKIGDAYITGITSVLVARAKALIVVDLMSYSSYVPSLPGCLGSALSIIFVIRTNTATTLRSMTGSAVLYARQQDGNSSIRLKAQRLTGLPATAAINHGSSINPPSRDDFD